MTYQERNLVLKELETMLIEIQENMTSPIERLKTLLEEKQAQE